MNDREMNELLLRLRQEPVSVPVERVVAWVKARPSRSSTGLSQRTRPKKYLSVWLTRVGLTKPN